jgi:hypothetical protein
MLVEKAVTLASVFGHVSILWARNTSAKPARENINVPPIRQAVRNEIFFFLVFTRQRFDAL